MNRSSTSPFRGTTTSNSRVPAGNQAPESL